MKNQIKSNPNTGQLQLSFIEESWKPVNGYHGHYSISDHGRVMSHKYGKDKIMKNVIGDVGYPIIKFTMGRASRKDMRAHRLVAIHFIPNPENKCCVNHKDSDRANNHISNLEWVSSQENSTHAAENDRMPKGINHHNSILDKNKVHEIRFKYSTGIYTIKEIAEYYGLERRSMGEVIHGITWKWVDYYPGLPERKQRLSIPKKSHYYS